MEKSRRWSKRRSVVVLLLSFACYIARSSGAGQSSHSCTGQDTCCDSSNSYDYDSPFRFNLDGLLSSIQNATKVPKQGPGGRISQFLSSPDDPTSSPEPAHGAWMCAENQSPEECEFCIDRLLNDIQSGLPDSPGCKRSTAVQIAASDGKCRVRFDRVQFWNPSDICQPLCCSAEHIEDGYVWNYGGNVLRAWNKTQATLKEKAAANQLSYRDFYDPAQDEDVALEDGPVHLALHHRFLSIVYIGYDCAPWVNGPQCLRCVDSLLLSLDHWYFREGEHCEDAVGMTVNDDHSHYSVNPHQEPGANVVRGGSGDWPRGQWPRGSCKLFFDNRPHPESLYV